MHLESRRIYKQISLAREVRRQFLVVSPEYLIKVLKSLDIDIQMMQMNTAGGCPPGGHAQPSREHSSSSIVKQKMRKLLGW